MLTSAFVFGVLAGLSIGPIAILILNLGLTQGWRSACLAGVGAALGDLVWAQVAFIGGSTLSCLLLGHEWYFKHICAILLLGVAMKMGMSSIQSLRSGKMPSSRNAENMTTKHGKLLGTFGLTCCNPLTAVVFCGFLARTDGMITLADGIVLGVMVFLGSLLVQMAIAFAGSVMRPLVKTPLGILAINLCSVTFLVIFAFQSLLT